MPPARGVGSTGAPTIVRLGGRAFRRIVVTDERPMAWFQTRLHTCGVDELVAPPGMAVETFALEVLDRVLRSAHMIELAGALLVPVALRVEDWSPDVAVETTNFLRELMAPADKRAVRKLFGEIIGLLAVHATLRATRPQS
jgi:hypothetical protein